MSEMGKRQLASTPPDHLPEDIHLPDVPNVGTTAPPIDPDDVPGLMVDKPKHKRKNSPTLAPLVIIAVIVAMVVLGALSTVIVERRSAPILVVQGDSRIEPPATLPADTTPQGSVSERWQPASVSPLAWDTWKITVNAGETYLISVNPISPDFTSIVGLYDSDGKLISTGLADRTNPVKTLTYTFTNAGTYTVLVSNIGGAAGNYEIMAQLER